MTDRMSEGNIPDRMPDRMSEDLPEIYARKICKIDMPDGLPDKYARQKAR